MVVRSISIMAGRDRVSAVLEPLLGFELGRERANNIAQVLIFSPEDAVCIAFGMLKSTGLLDPSAVAEEVAEAWAQGVRAVEAVEMEKVA
ncbi:MAG: hypothetical protein QM778_37935 [Myxococcales bacterium]